MGTSQSNPGPGNGTPLVPPWADDEPDRPLPLPDPNRFRSFRTSLGHFVKTGNRDNLISAVVSYANKSSGGGGVASRRLGAVNEAGANLFIALGGIAGGSMPGQDPNFLHDLVGKPCELAIAAIVEALTPENGDADKIRAAMNDALIEALDGIEVFDLNVITDELIVNIMISYLSECVFLQMVGDAGDAWKKAESPSRETAASEDLKELVKVVVDKYMAPKFGDNVRGVTKNELLQIEKQVIQEVWNEWSKL